MIIKKVKITKDNDEGPKRPKKPPKPMPPKPIEDGPREERRRGDRRRGYRRIDDRNLISRAHEEANAIREMSAREGFEYGVETSSEQLEHLMQAVTSLLEARDQAMKMAMNDVAQMSVMIAEKLIHQEVAADPDIVLGVVQETIKEMGKGHQSIVIKVNPADLAVVKENLPDIYPYGDSKTSISVIEEPSVAWGSCVVETNTGIIDASFTTQLQILQKAFEVGM